jgi:hypothetical protein
VLGVGVAKILGDRAVAAVLQIGSDRFDRRDLSGVACFNFIAAANLSRILKDLGAKNTRDVFDRIPPSSLAVPRMGAISLAVLGAVFELKHLGGDHPLEAWVLKHRAATSKRPVVTFDTLKHQQADHEEQDRKARKHARRNKAHGIRVQRFSSRQVSA